MLNEHEIQEMIVNLVGAEEVYGIQCNADQSIIQARVFVEELPYLHTYRRDSDSDKYYLEFEQALGQQKL